MTTVLTVNMFENYVDLEMSENLKQTFLAMLDNYLCNVLSDPEITTDEGKDILDMMLVLDDEKDEDGECFPISFQVDKIV